MAPRKSYWIFQVLGLAVLCLLLAAPAAQATLRHGELAPSIPGDAGVADSPTGDPTGSGGGGGGGEGGDPDDYSNLLRGPEDLTLDPLSNPRDARIARMPQALWSDPMFYAVLLWLGLDR